MFLGLVSLGIVLAVRGYWGTSARARRFTWVWCLVTGAVAGALAALRWTTVVRMIAALGPAATPTDIHHGYLSVAQPLFWGFGAVVIVALVALVGWAQNPERGAPEYPKPEHPPRRPQR